MTALLAGVSFSLLAVLLLCLCLLLGCCAFEFCLFGCNA